MVIVEDVSTSVSSPIKSVLKTNGTFKLFESGSNHIEPCFNKEPVEEYVGAFDKYVDAVISFHVPELKPELV